ncbi:MAG: DUF86 domain-containing protein [bacterium]|nr:DUF86 domain-containing protein [bacterium]
MVLKYDSVLNRAKELDTILCELDKYRSKTEEEIEASLSLRWIIERGLIAASEMIFDIADHILSGSFGLYPDTYEDSLKSLKENSVISEDLYEKIKGLGGFRNILIHEYIGIDASEVYKNFIAAFEVFPSFSKEIQDWLKLKEKI